jgi:putative transposase
VGGRRGKYISQDERGHIALLITEACNAGARRRLACELMGISIRTLQRWSNKELDGQGDQRKNRSYAPANKLNEKERQEILQVSNASEFKDLPPSQIVPTLADMGVYIASESSFYRVLKEDNQLSHRGKTKPRTRRRPESYTATGSNQVWTWDITYLPTSVKGAFYYLYMITDIYSRKIVGWEIHENQSDELSSELIQRACLSEKICRGELVLHSDNGSPMKGATMLAKLQNLGVVPSFSRPSVSNDNPYSESLFRTLKYTPAYPSGPFESIFASRMWVHEFVNWYNEKHKHSGIKFVSPSERHLGKDKEILANRDVVYKNARKENPARWSGKTRNWEEINEVSLNPGKNKNVYKTGSLAA